MGRLKKIPKFILINTKTYTKRKFKSKKRQELKKVMKAWSEFQSGCYYAAGYDEVKNVEESLKIIKDEMSIKNWGN